jgi:hypothetical protein
LRPLQRRQINPSPLGKDPLARGHFTGAERRDPAWWRGQHGCAGVVRRVCATG